MGVLVYTMETGTPFPFCESKVVDRPKTVIYFHHCEDAGRVVCPPAHSEAAKVRTRRTTTPKPPASLSLNGLLYKRKTNYGERKPRYRQIEMVSDLTLIWVEPRERPHAPGLWSFLFKTINNRHF